MHLLSYYKQIWNAYLGNLQSQEFCIVSGTSADVNPPTEAVDVVMDFLVERDVCEAYFTDDKNQGKKSALLISQLTGLSLKTKIKGSTLVGITIVSSTFLLLFLQTQCQGRE